MNQLPGLFGAALVGSIMDIRQIVADGDTTSQSTAADLRDGPTLYDPDRFTGNVFLALGEDPTLVDTGQLSGIVDVLRQFTDQLDKVLLTHQHGDHIQQLDPVVQAFDPDVYAFRSHPQRTHELADGETITIGDETVTALHTPGHAPDHLVFIADRTLFSGDLVVFNDEAFEGGSFGGTGGPGPAREQLIDSLERLHSRLPDAVDTLYPGHGDLFEGDVGEIIETAIERARERKPKYGP